MGLLGYTVKEMAAFWDVALSTVYLWAEQHDSFSDALKNGREGADQDIAETLYMRARDGDTTAMIFWLKNRQPSRWRDRKNLDHSGEIKGGALVVPMPLDADEWDDDGAS